MISFGGIRDTWITLVWGGKNGVYCEFVFIFEVPLRQPERYKFEHREKICSRDKVLNTSNFCFSSVQSLSHVRLFATPWTAVRQASLSITNCWSLPKPLSIESMMPSNHLILCCPLLLLPPITPSIKVFSNESTLRMRWPKYWSFSFSISPSNKHPELISFRMDWLDCLVSLWNACVVSWGTTSEPNQWNPCPHGAYILMEDID